MEYTEAQQIELNNWNRLYPPKPGDDIRDKIANSITKDMIETEMTVDERTRLFMQRLGRFQPTFMADAYEAFVRDNLKQAISDDWADYLRARTSEEHRALIDALIHAIETVLNAQDTDSAKASIKRIVGTVLKS